MEIKMLTSNVATRDMAQLADIVNRVYKEAEKGIWSDGQARTDAAEIQALAAEGELAIARVNGEVAGCVRISQIDADTGEFGILAVDQAKQGTGVGRKLVDFAEEKLRAAHVRLMQIKLLVPRAGMDANPVKVALHDWYVRLGYEKVGTELIDEARREIGIDLAIPCQFIVFRKKLW